MTSLLSLTLGLLNIPFQLQLKTQTSFLGGDDFRGANAVSAGHPAGTGGLPSPEFVPKLERPGLELRQASWVLSPCFHFTVLGPSLHYLSL